MDERCIPATPLRRRQLAESGDLPKSSHLVSAICFFGMVALGSATAKSMLAWMESNFDRIWAAPLGELTDQRQLQAGFQSFVFDLSRGLGGALGVCLVMMVSMNYLQTGRFFSWSSRPRTSWLPGPAIFQFLSFHSIAGLALTGLKVVVLIGSIYFVIQSDVVRMLSAARYSIRDNLDLILDLVFNCSYTFAIWMVFFGVADLLLQHLKYEKRIQMTPEELRNEMRDTQGDPLVISRRQAIRGEIHRNQTLRQEFAEEDPQHA